MTRHMTTVDEVLRRYADAGPYAETAAAFLEFDRRTGDDPVSLVAEAAAASTGQRYHAGVKPTVESFRETFLETGRATTFAALASLSVEDEALVEAFGARRKRRVLLEIARVLEARPEDDDLASLRSWAASADPYRYDVDPVGEISGVGPVTFQYLRMLAGVDTVRPGPEVVELVEAVADELESSALDASESLRTIASCEWLALESSFRRIEIDALAWWNFADEREREAAAGKN